MTVSTNPYTSQSISGYNASPPPDDGTQSTANQVEWAKHKTKIGDPIKTLAEAVNTAMVTAGSKSVNTSADVGSQIDGSLAFNWATATIGTDAITPSYSAVAVGAEAGATSDTLQAISATATAIYSGALLFVRQRHATEEIVIVHATSTAATATGANIYLSGQANFTLNAARKNLTLIYDAQVATATGWYEVTRDPQSAGGKVVQYTATSTAAVTTCSTVIPITTAPTDATGDQVFSFPITPTAGGNTLLVEFNGFGRTNTDPAEAVATLYASATTALAAQMFGGVGSGAGDGASTFLRYATTATGTAAKTFKIRCGPVSAANFHFNAANNTGTATFGGVSYSSLTIWEISA